MPVPDKLLNVLQAVRKSGLAIETVRILLYLKIHTRASHADLAAALAINLTSLPRYLTALCQSHHLAKDTSPHDQRAVLFALSEHGERLIDSLCKCFPK